MSVPVTTIALSPIGKIMAVHTLWMPGTPARARAEPPARVRYMDAPHEINAPPSTEDQKICSV
eukprot:CAMPEP_0184544296 /NCGR_PEP_ID=MMETSP0199_2-20130426/3532_1 /TAXON_ID=1112570 /ORGANISM="Thraustochytrium sp., Strain LLF1b" /LENGTH=62 /DNA_ID=CAMNT_0026938453 /DNA_START=111 /DNA_END=295 /DNA_ORIENTATION=-